VILSCYFGKKSSVQRTLAQSNEAFVWAVKPLTQPTTPRPKSTSRSFSLHFPDSSAGRRTRTRRATLPQAHRGEPSFTRRGGEIQSCWDVLYSSSVAGKEALPPLLAYFLAWILGVSSVVQDLQVRLPHSNPSCSTGDSGPSTPTGLSWISLLMRVRLNPQPHVRVRDLLVLWYLMV
jgi:hypothetical protein